MQDDVNVKFSAVGELVEKLTIKAEPAEIRRASFWLEHAGTEYRVPAEERCRLELCLNEVLANILAYGGESALAAPIYLEFHFSHDQNSNVASVSVSDAGAKFDLLELTDLSRPQSLEEAEPGGLGLIMLREYSDQLKYSFENGRNLVNFSVRWLDAD